MRSTLALLPLWIASPIWAQWIPQSSGTTAELRGLSVVSGDVAWASGTRGHVLHTTDGGRTWIADTVPGADTLDFRAVHAASAMSAWIMSAGPAESGQAKILRTDDAGAHWTLQFSTDAKGVFLDALQFWDDRRAIALSDPVDGQLFLLVTSDAGSAWARVPPAPLPPVLPGEAAFAASGTCLITLGRSNAWIGTGGGARARAFRSTDGGKTWSVSDTPVHAGGASSGIFSVAFADSLHGIAVGGDYSKRAFADSNVAITSDGGRTWRLPRGPSPAGYMSGVAFIPGTRGQSVVAVGLVGTALSTDGGESWRMVDSVAYNSVAFSAAGDGWAVGPRGRISRWNGPKSAGSTTTASQHAFRRNRGRK